MGWSIEVIRNEVNVSQACAEEMFGAQAYEEEIWYEVDEVTVATERPGCLCLQFNGDHMEHMDYLASNEAMVSILCKHKVAGDICFGSLEGDNAGSFWGYRFDGLGGVKTLEGRIEFDEVKETLRGKRFVLTGKLETMTRNQAHARIQDAGGTVGDTVTAATDYVVVGAKAGSKAKRAKNLGRTIIDEREFLALLKG